MKMKTAVVVTGLIMLSLTACQSQSGSTAMPEKHAIAYEDDLATLDDGYGADTFDGSLDSSQSKYYITNDYYNMKSDDELHIISNFETYQQTTEYSCGCATLKMVLHYYGVDDYDEMEIAGMAGTDESKGTEVEGVCKVLDTLGLKYESNMSTEAKFASFEDAEKYFIDCIDKKMPVMVNWEDWGGHWQVVIGLDTMGTESPCDDVVILADPYDVTDQYQDGYYTYPFARFVSMWREGSCSGKTVPYEQPYVTVIEE